MRYEWARAGGRANLVILCLAISAGIHAALVPEHFDEGIGPGVGFVIATVLPAFLAFLITLRPTQLAFTASAVLFAGLIVAYVFAVTTGIPLLHAEVETVDRLAVFTKAIEVLGLVAATTFLPRPAPAFPSQPKGTTQ